MVNRARSSTLFTVAILAIASVASLVAIWLAYPVLMAVLASIVRRRPPVAATERPTVSVVIATKDSPELIRERVDDILRTQYPADRLEVVVGFDAADGAIAPAIEFADLRVRVVGGDAPGGKAATLNAAVAATTASVLVFADAAQRFATDTIPLLVDAVLQPKMGAVSGALHIGTDGQARTLAERYWMFERWLREKEAEVHSVPGVTGAVYAMRRECWEVLPAGLILDDVYGPMRLVLGGWRVGFCAEARAFDVRRFTSSREFQRKARTLTGVLQLCAWLPGVLLPWRNPIWFQFVFHKLLRLASPYLLALALVGTVGALLPHLAAMGTAWLVAAGVVAVALCGLVVLIPRLRESAGMAFAMQAAVVRAAANGLRGRWDVWSR